jgi:hypothetical protein
VSLNALALSSGPIEGRVLDESTGQPVAGAIVVTTWNASDWSGLAVTRRVCYHVETATSDANGKFRIPAWSDGLSARGLFMHDHVVAAEAYKAGYVRPKTITDKPEIVWVAPFKGTKDEYFDYLEVVAGSNNCSGGGESRRTLYRLYEPLAGEAKSIAESREQNRLAKKFIFFANDVLVDYGKPTTSDRAGWTINVNPDDNYKKEDLLK